MKDLISSILNINLYDEYAYESLLNLFLTTKPFPVYTIRLKKDSFVFRTRENKGIKFKDFHELANPPINSVTAFGRANKPYQTVFYCSDSFETTITELMPNWFLDKKVAEKFSVTISGWKVIDNLKVVIIPNFKNEKMKKLLELIVTKGLTDDELMFISFINQLFSENSFNNKLIYKVTSAYCNALRIYFNSIGVKIDGLLYTSAQDSTGWNLALEPDVLIEGKIIIKNVFEQEIEKMDSFPRYNNFCKPIVPKEINYINKKIIWDE